MLSAAISDKTFRVCQDLGDQLRRSSLGIGAQQRFRSRSAEKNPSLRSLAIGGGVEKKLDAIEILFLHHTITSQTLRARVVCPLNRALLDLIRNMQVASAIVV